MPEIIPAIAAFATSSVVEGIAVNVAIAVGASLLSSVLSPPSSSAAATSGVDLQQQIGANTPIQFPLGFSATAGLLTYPGTWGSSGNTPNAYAVFESVLSFLPVSGHPVPWIGTQKCTVDWGATPTEQGYPITDFRDSSGVDYAWLQYDDGTQTSAPSYMVDKFASHPTRPYTTAMVGYGLAKVRLTLLLNQNLWSSTPDVLFETTGISLYNPAKDSSVGGSGSHRWGTYSTYEPSNNPLVQAYNVRRGIFYYPPTGSPQWVYGGDNKRAVSGNRLPVASWIAAINACDMLVTNADSTTEPQFRAGLVVTGDMQPVDLLQDLMGASNGRIAEVGGIYEVLAGAPGAAVYAFTDADIVVSDGQSFSPFPGLEDTYNAIEATYPEPGERWVSKDAPGRYNDGTNGTPDWEDEDGGRQLPASATFDAVPYANQVQRLMQTVANDNRQFRTHQFTLPPDAYSIVKPNRIVSWTSARNGYTNKAFIVTSVSGKQGWNQAVAIKEIDPSDYDYDASTQQLPAPVGSLTFETAPPQPMSGWEAFASTIQDNTSTDRRPAITIGCTGLMKDVQSVHAQVRLATTKQLVFDGYSPYDPTVTSPAWALSGGWCLAATAYEVRGKLVPFSGRITYWSNETESGALISEGAWLGVTTPNVLLTGADVANNTLAANNFSTEVQNLIGPVLDAALGKLATHDDAISQILEQVADLTAQVLTSTSGIAVKSNAQAAVIVTTESVSIANQQSIAQMDTDLVATFGGIGAAATFQMVTVADPLHGSSTISWFAKATDGTFSSTAAFQIGASVAGGATTSFANLMANNVNFIDTVGNVVSSPFFTDVDAVSLVPYVAIANLRFDTMLTLDGTSAAFYGNGVSSPYGESALVIG